jgi:hypothetical protein
MARTPRQQRGQQRGRHRRGFIPRPVQAAETEIKTRNAKAIRAMYEKCKQARKDVYKSISACRSHGIEPPIYLELVKARYTSAMDSLRLWLKKKGLWQSARSKKNVCPGAPKKAARRVTGRGNLKPRNLQECVEEPRRIKMKTRRDLKDLGITLEELDEVSRLNITPVVA